MRITVRYHQTMAPHRFEREPGFPYWTISLLLAGPMQVAVRSRSVALEPGTFSVIRPGTPYQLEVPRRERHAEFYALCLMPPHWKMWSDWPEFLPGWSGIGIRKSAAWRSVVEAFRTACRHSTAGETGEPLAFNSIERALLLAESVRGPSGNPIVDERIGRAIDYARARLEAQLTVPALARAASLSPSRLAHLFVEQLGESPMRHIEGLRMRRAQELLLSTRMRVREIAAAVGYDNPYHFSDRFRARIGRSPRAFRQQPL